MADLDKIAAPSTARLAEIGVPQLGAGVGLLLLGGAILIQQFVPKTFVAQELPQWIAILCAVALLCGERES